MAKLNLRDVSVSGEQLAKARQKAGLSQSQAARSLGVKRATVWNYENGKASPSADVLIRMLLLYDAPITQLAGITPRQAYFFRQNVSQ